VIASSAKICYSRQLVSDL